MNKKELGLFLRARREKLGLMQADLATFLGYDSTQFVSLFERGLSKVPLDKLGLIAEFLNIPKKKLIKALVSEYQKKVESEINRKAA